MTDSETTERTEPTDAEIEAYLMAPENQPRWEDICDTLLYHEATREV